MNEHIKLLKEQAMEWVPNMADPDTKIRLLNAGKFAELIVRECLTKVSEWDMGIDDPVGATDNTSEVARDIVAEIKEHFGVEE